MYPDNKQKIINAMTAFASQAMSLGATPHELHSWIDMQAKVHESCTAHGAARRPNHANRLRDTIIALCWFAPAVDVSLEDVLGWVRDRIESRDDIHDIMRRMQEKTPDVFEATFAAAAEEPGEK